MIGILKQMWLRRPRLNRIWATVLNFLIVGIVSIHLWWMAGYPLFNAELEFRRMERTNLMPRSEILFEYTLGSFFLRYSMYSSETLYIFSSSM